METAEDDKKDEQSLSVKVPKSRSFSPKISRPKLPTFTAKPIGHHGRAKTDPGRGAEIRAVLEDINLLKRVDFVKKYSRPKVLRMHPPNISHLHSSSTSPLSSPTAEEQPSSFNRNRSRSLRILTDKLKGPRGGGDHKTGQVLVNRTTDDVPTRTGSCLTVPEVMFGVSTGLTENLSSDSPSAKVTDDNNGSTVSSAQDTCTYEMMKEGSIDDSIPEDIEKEKEEDYFEDENNSLSLTSLVEHDRLAGHDLGDQDNLSRSSDKTSEDEGLCVGESESDSPPTTHISKYIHHHTINPNSQFLQLAATAPKRRTGVRGISLVNKGKIPVLHKSGSAGEEPSRLEDFGNRHVHRLDIGTGRKVMRFVTHPPQSSSTFPEEGAIDTNGFGYLRNVGGGSPPTSGELREQTSDLSLVDSVIGESLDGSSYKDVEVDQDIGAVASDSNGFDRQDRKNGKIQKQKSKSDPSGNKSNEPVHLPSVISSAQSYPLMRNGSQQERGSVDLKETVNDVTSPDPLVEHQQSLEASNSLDESQPSYLVENNENLRGSVDSEDVVMTSPIILESPQSSISVICGGITSAPATPVNQSPTSTIDRSQNYLNVPSSRKPIFRSASSVSVVPVRDRTFSGGNKDKELNRKHSLASAEDNSVTEGTDFLPLGDPLAIQATSMPNVRERIGSESPEREIKDKRYHIVEELYRNEKEYVEALKTLKDKYMMPLKTQSSLDDMTVDNIFYMIPEILTHHTIYLDFLDNIWKNWDPHSSTVGNLIKNIFCKQTILNSYLSFVENYKTAGKVIENALQTKSSVQKFIDQCQKDSGSKLSMKDLIVRPIQRIPRYELLIQRLLDNTPTDHPDYPLLKSAEQILHEFAMKIGTVNETQNEEDQQEALKKLEDLLMTDLAVSDRMYLRHDMVHILNKKDQCCIWMLSDLVILSSIKRKSGAVPRKVSIVLKSPAGQDYIENSKHKVWLRVALDDIEVVKSPGSLTRRSTLDKSQVEDDLQIINEINDLTSKLNCQHSGLEEIVKEMVISLNKQLEDEVLRYAESNKMELLVTTQEGVLHYEISFLSSEKRSSWEASFLDAKQKLSLLTDKRAPEFLQPLQITKTRAGMQFSCAAPIDGLNSDGYRDIWVCNSDGYVGHMCLLSLQPEPIVTLNTPVPGCNARILCICAVPAYQGLFRRRSSTKRQHKQQAIVAVLLEKPMINIEQVDDTIPEDYPGPEEGYQSDSSSSDDEDDEVISISQKHKEILDDINISRLPVSQYTESSPDPISQTGSWSQDSHKSTMWLGTEDGCIHIFQCTDNIKTTKNKLKIHHGSPVYCVIYLDNKVFVSLANGDLIVYKRDQEGLWDTENPYTRSIGSVQAPVNKMLPVAGKLWCGSQNSIKIINPLTLSTEVTFQVTSNANRCIQCIVSSGQGVWIATTQSSKVMLYHATSYEFLMDVSIAQAVAQKLHSADDIIRQHKAACLRITALMVCKDLLWVGTSAGVILTIPMPRITSMTTRASLTVPVVTGLVYGHTGHVRFLTCIDMANSSAQSKTDQSRCSDQNENLRNIQDQPRRASMAATMATLATRMLVISGGDGYEDFRTNVSNESAGRDDSTNHLLLWQV